VSLGGKVELDATVVRDPRSTLEDFGYIPGVELRASAWARIERSLIQHRAWAGIEIVAAEAHIHSTLIRAPGANWHGAMMGLTVRNEGMHRGVATINGSVIEGAIFRGVEVISSDLTMDATIVRGTRNQGIGPAELGIGLAMGVSIVNRRSLPSTFPWTIPGEFGAPAKAAIRRSVIEHNDDWGIYIQCSDATIESTIVRDTLGSTPTRGVGIEIHSSVPYASDWWAIHRSSSYVDPPSNVTIRASQVERSRAVGIFIEGTDATLESVTVSDTTADVAGRLGMGILVQPHGFTGWPSNVTIRGALVERSVLFGIYAVASSVTIEDTLVRETMADAGGRYGDGIGVLAYSHLAPVVVRLSSVDIESSERAGLSNLGGAVELRDTAIRCSEGFDIHADPNGDSAFRLIDLGGNHCGCPDATGACEVVGAEFSPPTRGN
jgi:hypothetical protein